LACRIEYKSSVAHDLKNLDKAIAKRVIKELAAALSNDADCGEALTGLVQRAVQTAHRRISGRLFQKTGRNIGIANQESKQGIQIK
jgi:mRNA-degrading endonuclease RelE of RelBE toxin-antitoxin system